MSSSARRKTAAGGAKRKTTSRVRRVDPTVVTRAGRQAGRQTPGEWEPGDPLPPPKPPTVRPIDHPYPGDVYRYVVDIDWSFPPPAEATRRIERQVRQVVLAEVATWDLEGDLVVREVVGGGGRGLQVAVRR